MKIGRSFKVIGTGLLGGVIVGVLFVMVSFTAHWLFFPDQPIIRHVGWAKFIQIYLTLMCPGFLAGILVSAFKLRPIYGLLIGGLSGTILVALMYTVGLLLNPQFISASYLWLYTIATFGYGVMSAIAGCICGFLSPPSGQNIDRISYEPPSPDQFDFGG